MLPDSSAHDQTHSQVGQGGSAVVSPDGLYLDLSVAPRAGEAVPVSHYVPAAALNHERRQS